MAEQRRIDYTVGFKTDKSGLNQIKKSLEEIRNLTQSGISQSMGVDTSTAQKNLQAARKEAVAVETAFRKAFNQKLNTVNIDKFNQSLKQSNTSLQQVYQNFSSVGAAGQNAFRTLINQMTNSNFQLKETSSLLKNMGTTLMNTIKWNIASSAVNSISGSIQQAYGYVKNLDTSLNDIRIVTGKSADEMTKFAEKANDAAKALKKSTTDYTNASLIFYQQGLGDQEVEARTEVTLKAANVTQQDTAEVSEQLTAIWNGYKVSAEEAELYIDKVAAVAANTAADLEELSSGMSKVASAANLMGVDIDQLNAQLATVVSVTRQAPESVGTAFKTIYARMGDIEAGLDDETTLGNYTQEMADMGFNVLDANNKLRDMGEIIEEIGNKWTTLSREQQVALSQTMAGTRQYNNLLSLFDNWDMYTEALQTSADAAGTLQEQQDIYAESTKAHLQELATATEGIFDSMLDANAINTVADALLPLVNGVERFIDSIGGGIGLLNIFGPLLMKAFGPQIAENIVKATKNLQAVKDNKQSIENKKTAVQSFYEAEGKLKQQTSKDQATVEREDGTIGLRKSVETRIKSKFGDSDEGKQKAQEKIEQYKQTIDTYNEEKKNLEQKRKEEKSQVSPEDKESQDKIDEEYNNKSKELEEKLNQTLSKDFPQLTQGFDEQTKSILNANNALSQLAEHLSPKQFEIAKQALDNYTEAVNKNAIETENAQNITDRFNTLLQSAGTDIQPLSLDQMLNMSDEDWDKYTQKITQGMQESLDKVNAALTFSNDDALQSDQFQSNEEFEKHVENIKEIAKKYNIAIGEITNPEQLTQASETLSQYLGNSEQILEEIGEQTENAAEKVKDSQTELANSQQEMDSIFNEQNLEVAINSFNDVASSVMGMTGAVSTFIGIGDIWQNQDLSTAEKFVQTMIAIGTASAAAFNSFKTLKSGLSGLIGVFNVNTLTTQRNTAATVGQTIANAAETVSEEANQNAMRESTVATEQLTAAEVAETGATAGQTIANAAENATEQGGKLAAFGDKAKAAFGGLKVAVSGFAGALGISVATLGIAVAAIAALGVAIYACVKAYNADADAAKKATEIHKELKKTYEDEKQALEDLRNSLNAYSEAQNAIDGLVKGTEEWAEATEEANAQVLELLSKYPELAQYISDVDGRLQISAEGQKALIDDQKEQVKKAQHAEMQSAIQENKANTTNEITQAHRKTGIDRDTLNKVIADVEVKGLSALETSILEQNGYSKDEIKSIQENSQDIINLSNKVEANTKANEILSENILKSTFSEDEKYNAQSEQSQQVIDKIAETWTSYSKYEIKEGSTARETLDELEGKTLTDAQIQKMYKDLMGYTSSTDKFGNKADYTTKEGDVIADFTDEAAANAILQSRKEEALLKDLPDFIEISNQFKEISNSLLTQSGEQIESLSIGDFSQLTSTDIENLREFDIGEALRQAFENSRVIRLSEEELKDLSEFQTSDEALNYVKELRPQLEYLSRDSRAYVESILSYYFNARENLNKAFETDLNKTANVSSSRIEEVYNKITSNYDLTDEQKNNLITTLETAWQQSGDSGIDQIETDLEGKPLKAVIEYEFKPKDENESVLSEDIRKQLEELKIAEEDFERYKKFFGEGQTDQQIINSMAAQDNVAKIQKDEDLFKNIQDVFINKSRDLTVSDLDNLDLISDTMKQLSGGVELSDDWILEHLDLIQQYINGSEEAQKELDKEISKIKISSTKFENPFREIDTAFKNYQSGTKNTAISNDLKAVVDEQAAKLGYNEEQIKALYMSYGYYLGDDGQYYKDVGTLIRTQQMFDNAEETQLTENQIKEALNLDELTSDILEEYGLKKVEGNDSLYESNTQLKTTFTNTYEVLEDFSGKETIAEAHKKWGTKTLEELEEILKSKNIPYTIHQGTVSYNLSAEEIFAIRQDIMSESVAKKQSIAEAHKELGTKTLEELEGVLKSNNIPYTIHQGMISYTITAEEALLIKQSIETLREESPLADVNPTDTETGKKETPEVDKFRDINAELEKYNTQLERLQKNQEDLTGKDLEENLQKQAELYKKQADAIERKLKLQQQELAAKKKELADFGVSFDEEGYITNGVDRLSANINNDEEYKKLEKAISEYEDALSNTISLQDDFSDSIRSSANKQYEANLAGINGEIDDSAEALEKAQKEYEKFSKEFEDMTDEEKAASKMSFGDFMIAQIEAMDEYLSDLEEKKKQIEEEAIKLNIGIEFDENGENNIDDIKSEYVKKLDEVNEKLQDQNLDSKTREELIAQSEEYSNIIGQLDTMKDDHKEIQDEIEDSAEKAKEYAKAMDISRFIKENTDVYYDVNKEMDGLDRQLSHLQKASKGLEGTALINNLQQQSKIIDQQIKAQKTKIALAKQELKIEQGKLQTKLQNLLADKKLTVTAVFDENGMVDNYNEILEDMKKANKLSEEDAKLILGYITSINNAGENAINLSEKLLDLEYSKEDIQQQIQDVYSSMAEEGQKAAEDAAESMEDELNKRLEWFNMKVDVELDISEATRRLNDLKKRIQGLEDNDILGNAVKNLENLKTYFTGNINSYFGAMDSGAVSGLTSHLNAIMSEIGIMQAGGTSSLYGTDQSKAFDDLNNYRDQLMDQLESVEDLKEQIEASYLQMIDKIADKLSDIANDYKQIDSLIQHDMNLIKMVYGENSFDKLALYFDQKVTNDMGALAQARKEQERWKALLDSAEKGSEAWDKYYENYKNATNNLNSLLESSIQDALDRYNNLVNQATYDLTKKLSGGYNQDYIDADWERAIEMSDKYLDNINKAYEIQSLRNKMNISISDTASLKAQQKIRDVMEEQLKILEEKEYVTQYDVDRANKIYDITMKQIALEEAQNNKSQMKLRRDSQGNYRYEYVSDQDDIAQKQQELLEAQNELYNFDKDRYREVLQEAQDAYKEFSSRYIEILTSTAYTEEEKAQLIDQLKANYYEAQLGRMEDLGTVEGNLLASADTMGQQLLGKGIETLEGLVNEADTAVTELVHNTFGEDGPINTDIVNTFDNLRTELANLQDEIRAMAEQAGVDFEQLANGLDPAIEYTKQLIEDNKDLLASYDEELIAIQNVIAELANLEEAYNKVKEAAIAAIEEALKLREQESSDGDLGEDTGAGSETGGSGGGNGSGGNYGANIGDENQKPSGVTIYKGIDGDYANIMYVKKDSLKNGITVSDISKAAARENYNYSIIDSVTMRGSTPWVKAINNSEVKPEKAVRKDYLRFDTGGYTGDWNSKEGKIAMLHEKELVLNKQDTSNILMAVSIVRTLSAKLSDMTNNMMNSISRHNAATSIPTQDQTLEQNVKIEASFPNVKNSNDIEQALNNLVNTASMYAMRTKR